MTAMKVPVAMLDTSTGATLGFFQQESAVDATILPQIESVRAVLSHQETVR